MQKQYDVVVIGAGPAGCACAISLAASGVKVALVDKARFPRDKVCGDGISPTSLRLLDTLGLSEALRDIPHNPIYDAVIGLPLESAAPLSLGSQGSKGVVCRRVDFDHLLYKKASEVCEVFSGFELKGLLREQVQISGVRIFDPDKKDLEIKSKIVVGADGSTSRVARELGREVLPPQHTAGAARGYFEGVLFEKPSVIEFHFFNEILPGYFWIFPTGGENGGANVGLGLAATKIKKEGVAPKVLLKKIIETHPRFKKRFENAKAVSKLEGWSLPLGPRPEPLCFDGAVLIGDAASLVNPISGEGIGNALLSGTIAASTIKDCLKTGNLKKENLAPYEQELYAQIGKDLKYSNYLNHVLRSRLLMMLFSQAVNRSARVKSWVLRALSFS